MKFSHVLKRYKLITILSIVIITFFVLLTPPSINIANAINRDISNLRTSLLGQQIPDNWLTYNNEFDHYSISYPEELHVYPALTTMNVVYITNYDLEDPSNQYSQSPLQLKIEIAVIPNLNRLPLDTWLEENNQLSEQTPAYEYASPSETLDVVLDGREGIYEKRSYQEHGDVKTWYVALDENKILIVNFRVKESFESTFTEILNTLRID